MGDHVFTTQDKTTWGDGPWQTEPDKVVWIDEVTRLDCMANRGPSGSWCGYVGVDPSHRMHGKGYSECLAGCPAEEGSCYDHSPEAVLSVHGGLTYAKACWGDEATGICHVPEPGRSHDIWWFGFDCAHYQDFSPGSAAQIAASYHQRGQTMPDCFNRMASEIYRDLVYVRAEVTSLAAQIAAPQ